MDRERRDLIDALFDTLSEGELNYVVQNCVVYRRRELERMSEWENEYTRRMNHIEFMGLWQEYVRECLNKGGGIYE